MIIDNKGKLFGKVSILDIAIVLVIIGALAGVYILGLKSSVGPSAKTSSVTLTFVTTGDIKQATADCLNLNDFIKDDKGVVLGRLSEKEVTPLKYIAYGADGKWVLSEKPGFVSIKLVIQGDAVISYDAIKISGNPYQAGMSMFVQAKAFRGWGYFESISEKK